MALINTLRNKMGKVIVGFIAVAILSFVLTDLLSGQRSILAGNDRDIGEIAGETITYEEFQERADVLVQNYASNFGRNPGADELNSLRNQAWLLLVAEKSFDKEYKALGITVSPEELVDLVQGKNISPDIQRIFTDPQTGQFNKDQLLQTLNQLNGTPQGRAQWKQFEESLIPGRKRVELDNLIDKSTFVTDAEAEREYKDQNAVAEVKYLYVPFFAVNDSSVNVTDAELENYIDGHKDEYQVDWSRSIEYVSFPIVASSADSLAYREELREIKEEFSNISDDSLYATSNSELSNPFDTYTINSLPAIVASNLNIIHKGTVVGPYIDGNSYVLYKLSDVYEDTTGVARASHILIKWDDDSNEAKAKAKSEALSVLREVQGGADFAEVAKEKSKDGGSAINGGDLDWFETGKMVKPFNDAVFGATKKGIIPQIVESQFGYHIIDVTEVPSFTKYKVATVGLDITASDETRDEAFRKADYFAGTSGNYSDFKANAEKEGYSILNADNIEPNDQRIARIGKARQVIGWLFRDASEGEVSPVYELDDQYVVAVMTGEQEEGTAGLNEVRLEVTEKVKNEKKGELIVQKLKQLSGSLDDIAYSYGEDASVLTSSNVKISTTSLPSAGGADEAIGKAFSLSDGQVSDPIATDNGIVIIQLEGITPAPEIADYTMHSNNLKRAREGRSSYYLGELIKEAANVKDERYKFF
ncbi:MAG: peptidylprolyl isomerase [Cyclobacteriaceae bacterium]|nr:peptidylprolyl isomerase [Cyclobacteriaceae bacterium]